jgi:uncharacterized membrane protein
LVKGQSRIIGALFIVAGALHFVRPRMYEAMIPPYLPDAHALVLISGVCEMLGGAGVLLPATRIAAGRGLIALLVSVFPANVYMATDAERFRSVAPAGVLWARLLLQFVLVWWVYRACVAPRR